MEKNFTYHNTLISYQVLGQGKPVLLIHGFGEDSSIWKYQIEFLKDYCKLLVPDLPGSGQSSLLQKNKAPVDDYASCLYELLLHESIDKAVVLGHSMGGYITLAMAEKHPGMLDGFGLIHSTAFADTEEKIATRKKGIEFIRQHGAYAFLKTSTPNLFSKNTKEKHPGYIDELVEKGKRFSAEALVQYYEAMISRPDRTAVLQQATVPVLFIIGTEDAAAPLDDLAKQIHLPEVSHIHILEQVGHMSMVEASEELSQHMLGFINN
jgi:pimeloyl-ACP methyl ester carboxylesterase